MIFMSRDKYVKLPHKVLVNMCKYGNKPTSRHTPHLGPATLIIVFRVQ